MFRFAQRQVCKQTLTASSRRFACKTRPLLATRLSEGAFYIRPVLGVPFIKISLRFARTTGGRPYRRCVVLSFLIVGTGV